MKKTLLITGVLLALSAAVASAAGVNMYWNDCGTGLNGITNKTFACTSNVPNHDIYVSVDPPDGVVNTNGHNHIIDLISLSPTLTPWWDFKNPGTCRINSMIASGDFSVSVSGGIDCPDPWSGTGNAGVAAYTKDFGGDPRRARIIGSVAYSGPAVAMTAGTEYYSIRLRINSQKTVGTGLCAGCSDPVCLVLNQVRIAQPAPDPTFAVENPRDSNFITWQGGAVGGPGCPGATPATNSSWGKVKSLYR